MASAAIYSEQDRYAERVSTLLREQGLVSDEEDDEMRRFLRGW